MGLMKTVVIIVLLIIAFAFFFPTEFTNLKNDLFNKVGIDKPAQTTTGTTTNNVATTTPNNTTETTVEPVVNETLDNTEERQTIICGRPFSDYPDYYGTIKWGQDCGSSSLECVNYPPSRYTGDGEISCCVDDGKCYWS